MKRNTLNFLIDVVSALVLLGMVLTGLLMEFVLPPGSRGLQVWGLDRHGWGQVHFWLACVGLGLVLVHVALHWSWVCTTLSRLVLRRSGPGSAWRRNSMGAGVLVAVTASLLLFVLVAGRSVEPGRDDHRGGRGQGWGRIDRSTSP